MFKFAITISLALSLGACSESFTDSRDGQNYNVVKIGNHIWMAENLNFKTDSSSCPDGDSRNCKKFGSLYTYETARNICPEGFRLPSKSDFEDLLKMAGENAGNALKSTSGWYKKGGGKNTLGFDAMPAGFMTRSNKFDGIGGYAQFWSSSVDENEQAFAYYMELEFSTSKAVLKTYDQGDARSVRCVK